MRNDKQKTVNSLHETQEKQQTITEEEQYLL